MLKTRLRSRLASRLTTLPSAVVYDVDALDYFTRAEALGGSFDQTAINATYTDTYVKTAFNDYVLGLKADAVWSNITELYLLTGVTFGGLMAKLKYDSVATLTNSNFVTGDYLAAGSGAGLTGNVTSKKLSTGLSTVSGQSFSTYNTTDATAASSGQARLLLALDNSFGVNIEFRFGGQPAGTVYAIGDSSKSGDWTVGYALNTGTKAFKNGAFDYTSANTKTSSNVYLFGRSSDGALNCDCSLSAAHVGLGLTDAEAANLSTRTNALMTALGANVY